MYRVTCHELEDHDPHEGRHDANSAREVLEMVEDYVACLRNGYLEAVTDERPWLGPNSTSTSSATVCAWRHGPARGSDQAGDGQACRSIKAWSCKQRRLWGLSNPTGGFISYLYPSDNDPGQPPQ